MSGKANRPHQALGQRSSAADWFELHGIWVEVRVAVSIRVSIWVGFVWLMKESANERPRKAR